MQRRCKAQNFKGGDSEANSGVQRRQAPGGPHRQDATRELRVFPLVQYPEYTHQDNLCLDGSMTPLTLSCSSPPDSPENMLNFLEGTCLMFFIFVSPTACRTVNSHRRHSIDRCLRKERREQKRWGVKKGFEVQYGFFQTTNPIVL